MKAAIKYHLKNIRYTLLNVTGLSVGIAVFILLIIYIRYETGFDSFHQNRERIYRVEHILKEGDNPEKMVGCPAPLGPALMNVLPEIEEMTRVFVTRKFRRFEVTDYKNQSFQLDPLYVDPSFLHIFSFLVKRAAETTLLSDPFTIVLTEETAQLIFADEDPVGKVLVNENNLYTVTGIIENVPENSHIQFNSLCSVSTFQALDPDDDPFSWSDNWLSVYIMLRKNTDWAAVDGKIKNILRQLWKENTDNELYLQPLQKIHLFAGISGDYALTGDIKDIIVLTLVAFTILIMAGVNYSNLAVAQSLKYSRYAALRKINGASAMNFVWQIITESTTITFSSMLISIVLVIISLPFFNNIVGRNLVIGQLWDPSSLLLILIAVITLGLLSAAYPACVTSGVSAITVLRGASNSKRGRSYPRSILMIFQFIISITLVLSTLNIIRQVKYMADIDFGYDDSNMIRIEVSDTSWNRVGLYRDRITKDPRILEFCTHDYPVNNSTDWCRIGWDGSGQGEYLPVGVNYVDNNFIRAYNLQLMTGSGFQGASPDLYENDNQVILNESAIKS